jgi:hypothetical protein
MRKLVFISLILLAATSCKQTKWAPEGPTDIRVRNLQGDLTFNEVIVKTAGGRDTTGNIKEFGTIAPGAVSDYHRVKFAYPKAEITAKINGVLFSTGEFQSTYLTYLSTMRVTYEVYISNMDNKVLTINKCIPDEELILK